MAEWDAKRQVLAALVARRQGLDDPARLDPEQRGMIDREVEALADGHDPASPEPADPGAARLHRATAEYRAARALRAGEDDVRLAERGEVFSTEDDA